ncbi:MAG: hypothetical protein UY94_C0013G0010 [Parcubacteria group bacterium GW2011_GWA2_56_21]|nr:MAG: hypothetical protein UY94_C0013G0010 [Parcubacteria group bacterium GW2011_GWA2_56_21]
MRSAVGVYAGCAARRRRVAGHAQMNEASGAQRVSPDALGMIAGYSVARDPGQELVLDS